jgi:hypothetical protein
VCGAWAHALLGRDSLYVNVALFSGIGLLYVLVVAYDRNESFFTAMFGEDHLYTALAENCESSKKGTPSNNAVDDRSDLATLTNDSSLGSVKHLAAVTDGCGNIVPANNKIAHIEMVHTC